MTVKLIVATPLVLCVGSMLASCSPFSDFVADHWPHFAGGEPGGLPPRPGAPGYNKFIEHGQATQIPAAPDAPVQPAATSEKAVVPVRASAGPPQMPAGDVQKPLAPEGDAVQGGLY